MEFIHLLGYKPQVVQSPSVLGYGRLYNWYAVNTGKLAPTGWHVPTDTEFWTLITYLGGSGVAGGPLKETGTTHWDSPNTGATNTTGFTGKPAGTRFTDGTFQTHPNTGAEYWSSTIANVNSAFEHSLNYTGPTFYSSNPFYASGLSIRCIRDNDNSNTTVTDGDGNFYTSVTIGTQTWLAQNLATSKYNDGTSIPNVTDNTAWSALLTGAYCNYLNDINYVF